jgi:hypothetical protein
MPRGISDSRPSVDGNYCTTKKLILADILAEVTGISRDEIKKASEEKKDRPRTGGDQGLM